MMRPITLKFNFMKRFKSLEYLRLFYAYTNPFHKNLKDVSQSVMIL